MSNNYRCSIHRSCGARRTLKKPIDHYKIRPKCLSCKRDTLKPVEERARAKARKCDCDGFIHPHTIGSEPWCVAAKVGPTENDQRERYERL